MAPDNSNNPKVILVEVSKARKGKISYLFLFGLRLFACTLAL